MQQQYAFAPVGLNASGMIMLEYVVDTSDLWQGECLNVDSTTGVFYPVGTKTLPIFTAYDREGAMLVAKDVIDGRW